MNKNDLEEDFFAQLYAGMCLRIKGNLWAKADKHGKKWIKKMVKRIGLKEFENNYSCFVDNGCGIKG